MCKMYLDHIHPQLLPETSPRLLLNIPPSKIYIIFFLKEVTLSPVCGVYMFIGVGSSIWVWATY